MVKASVEVDTNELQTLRNRVRELEGNRSTELTKELGKLQKLQVRSAAKIPYKIIDDHKNVVLYTRSNHRVGPLHPNNAVSTMMRWAEQGVQLFTTPFSEEEVAEYKKSKEWTDFVEKNRAARAKFKKKDLGEQFEKFAEMIAKSSGRSVEEMNQVIPRK